MQSQYALPGKYYGMPMALVILENTLAQFKLADPGNHTQAVLASKYNIVFKL